MTSAYTLICFSHLRWDFVFQRPQHLMSRFARSNRVIYWEEPIFEEHTTAPKLETRHCATTGVTIVTPHVPRDMPTVTQQQVLRSLLDILLADCKSPLVRWYYTPLMLPFSRHVIAAATIYDCMDELANFRFASPELIPLERQLLALADVVFTGGFSLYEAKKDRHPAVHLMPSSVDQAHFKSARHPDELPDDLAGIPAPRLGFFGVIDERMDVTLLAHLADAHPDWSLVMVGPVVKIDANELPRRPNIHYLGAKPYGTLPAYLAGWQVALMPFALNESTRFISPTKTPEYLAGGTPIVSTPITDVVQQYGNLTGVFIANDPTHFVTACEQALTLNAENPSWLEEADAFLATQSWDLTQARMAELLVKELGENGWSRPMTLWSDRYDYVVVGAGFAGAVLAERLASQHGAHVLVIDRREHVAGNAYDRRDESGILIHQYGPHIFHTNSDDIVTYLSQFTAWRAYEHRVLASVRDTLVPFPINRTTLNRLYDLALDSDAEAAAWLSAQARCDGPIENAEDMVIAAVGRELYELFYQGYTRKQWGVDPSRLDKAVTARIPTRTDCDDRYFTDKHQLMPANGYTALFNAMLDHPHIDLALGVEWADVKELVSAGHVIFTGPIDEYFDHRFGRLPYRSLRFDHQTLHCGTFQPVGVVNYPDPAVPYTRITEYKHLTGQRSHRTSITYEFPSDSGEPYYPMPTAAAQACYRRYRELAEHTPDVTFVGRLATYRYYNMDQVIGQALATFKRMGIRQGIRIPEDIRRSIAI